MKRTLLWALSLMVLFFIVHGLAVAEEKILTKADYELDELYSQFARLSALTDDPDLTALQRHRNAVKFHTENDTIWVEVFVTVDRDSIAAAEEEFNQPWYRRFMGTGALFSGQVMLRNLPETNNISYVNRIEPVVPNEYSSSGTIQSSVPVLEALKKNNSR